MKVGLTGLSWSVTILKRIGKDKKFAKWLISHKNELTNKHYYIPSILKSYKTGKPLDLCLHIKHKKELSRIDAPNIKELFHNDMERLLSYIEKHNINFSTYEDYLSACKYLGFKKLAELSLNHELKGKENDLEYIKEHFNEFMKETERIINIIKNYLGDE